MIPQSQVQQTLLTAQLKAADMTLANITALTGGTLSVKWGAIDKAQWGINAVARQYSLGDFSSVSFLNAYSCLTSFVGTYAGGAIDPNAQVANTIIEVVGVASAITRILFTDTLTINWQTDIAPGSTLTYAALLGNEQPIYSIYSVSGTEYDSNTPQLSFFGNPITTATCNQPGTWLLVLSA